MNAGAVVEVDHLHTAPRLAVRLGKFAVELKPLKALIAGLGQAHEGIFAEESKTAHEAGAERDDIELGVFR